MPAMDYSKWANATFDDDDEDDGPRRPRGATAAVLRPPSAVLRPPTAVPRTLLETSKLGSNE